MLRAIGFAIVAFVVTFIVMQLAQGAFASTTSVSPAQRTCQAFKAWDHHRTVANLDRLMTASERAPWHNLGLDVSVVYFDVRDHDTVDLPNDAGSVRQYDCHQSR